MPSLNVTFVPSVPSHYDRIRATVEIVTAGPNKTRPLWLPHMCFISEVMKGAVSGYVLIQQIFILDRFN